MTRSKLSDLEKQEIIALFEQQQETIASLADRYQVSSSTIRRLLKQPSGSKAVESDSSVPVQDFKPKPIPKPSKVIAPLENEVDSTRHDGEDILLSKSKPVIASKRVKTEPKDSSNNIADVRSGTQRLSRGSLTDLNVSHSLSENSSFNQDQDELTSPALIAEHPSHEAIDRGIVHAAEELSEIIQEIGHGLDQSFGNVVLEDEDEDDEDDEEDDFDESDYDADDGEDFNALAISGVAIHLDPEVLIEVIPFSEATLPKTCYLVIDRTAELVTRPLKDFGELGQIPEHEVQSCTLPVFDNHRVARRFSHRNHRIIKVPNADMLKKTCTQLSAKGITRLLVNGHIYSL